MQFKVYTVQIFNGNFLYGSEGIQLQIYTVQNLNSGKKP
jgi:hypothetical protein